VYHLEAIIGMALLSTSARNMKDSIKYIKVARKLLGYHAPVVMSVTNPSFVAPLLAFPIAIEKQSWKEKERLGRLEFDRWFPLFSFKVALRCTIEDRYLKSDDCSGHCFAA
jgi:hypothetical protein